jgi:hypothetical protein
MNRQQYKYHQINITNEWIDDDKYKAVPIKYSETMQMPLLEENEKWEMAIERFDIDSSYVPIYYFPVLPNDATYGNTDWTKSNLIFTLEYNGVSFSQHLHLIQRNFKDTVPSPPPLGKPWPLNIHYFIYHIDHLVAMFNATLAAAFAGLGLLIALPGGAAAPKIIYDNGSRTLSFLAPYNTYRDALAIPIQVYMNNNMNEMFDNWYTHMSANDMVNHLEHRLVIPTKVQDKITIGAVDYLEIRQPYPNLYALCEFRYLEIRSGLLSVEKETKNTLDLSYQTQTEVKKQASGILIDFEVVLQDITSVRSSSWVYISKGKPTWLSMMQNPSLDSLDLTIYLKDNEGRYYPLYLETGKSATVKLVFRKKKVIY